MHISFTKHDPRISTSSKGILEYLDKENIGRESEFEDLKESEDLELSNYDQQIENQNLFFTNVENNEEKFLTKDQASDKIDDNLSYRSKENESKFFMLNISPGKDEIEHLNEVVNLELKSKGIGEKEQEILSKTEEGSRYLNLIKNDLIHQSLREYTRDVMKNYAENFDRTVYANPDKLPSQKEEKEINHSAKQELFSKGISPNDSSFAEKYQKLREQKAKDIGKDFSVRKMDENDLVWFAKVEEKRTYKGNDNWVMANRKIQKRINELSYSTREDVKKEVEDLQKQLFKDKVTGQVIREGMRKGGQQYHVHVIVSRYDNCPNKRHRKSISPLSNHRAGTVANKNIAVGFNRDNFFKKSEQSFDQKFHFQRTRSYEKFNQQKKERKAILSSKVKATSKTLVSQITSPIKQEILKNSGIQELSKLNIMNGVSKELGFRIPLSVPKSPLQMVYKITRSAVGKVLDVGKGY
ncbi:DUF5712 family protein [Chryseobacterium balustinum]|uniref:Mobilization protein n=1 Tax=Chryseobacterium balustinum TaxID=246 RepID=A0ABY1LBF1_9FLAO|nr:DUF5712 family protein [Chryseobacterium balustinum]SKB93924.1 hypothetical protein SAMN05421800_11552 [Chryseobacterium balustinum]